MTEIETVEERHATWLELFFDLVVVAAIAQLAHRLHGETTPGEVAVFAGLYLAVWLAWTSFTLYANVAGDATRTRAMLLAMLGIAVMAASVPDATGDRARAFAAAYVLVRLLGLSAFARTRQMLLDWPSAQVATGVIPWIVSLFVQPPARYVLWGVGLGIDIVLPILASLRPGVPDETRRKRRSLDLREARLDLGHLAERLGLFVIIVLGEGVVQLVAAAAEVAWTRPMVVISIAGFALLVGLFWPTLVYGFFGNARRRHIPVRVLMPIHFLTVASITMIASGLGVLAEHASGHSPHGSRWLLAGGLAAYYLAATAGGIIVARPVHWLLGWAAPGIAGPMLLAAFGDAIPTPLFVCLLVVVVLWEASYAWFDGHVIRVQNGAGSAPVEPH